MSICFSIVLCTYNGERTIGMALDALLKLKKQSELLDEIMVVDNASTDKTKVIIHDFIKINGKIRYIYEERAGLSYARRHAVNARAPWIIYVDDDNVLASDWLVELEKIIKNNPGVGIINGAVIGIPIDDITYEEKIRFEAIYPKLACTHLYEFSEGMEVINIPMGAGLCIISSAIKKVDQEGWLRLIGRKGNELFSGEDTELCNKVVQQGYTYLRDYRLQLKHMIPKYRLTEEYTTQLLEKLIMSKYLLISTRKYYVLERLLRFIKYGILYLCNKLKKKVFSLSDYETEKNRQLCIIYGTFIKCVLKDYLIIRH